GHAGEGVEELLAEFVHRANCVEEAASHGHVLGRGFRQCREAGGAYAQAGSEVGHGPEYTSAAHPGGDALCGHSRHQRDEQRAGLGDLRSDPSEGLRLDGQQQALGAMQALVVDRPDAEAIGQFGRSARVGMVDGDLVGSQQARTHRALQYRPAHPARTDDDETQSSGGCRVVSHGAHSKLVRSDRRTRYATRPAPSAAPTASASKSPTLGKRPGTNAWWISSVTPYPSAT